MTRFFLLALTMLLFAGCGDDDDCRSFIEYGLNGGDPCSKPPDHRDPTNVLKNLQASYLRRKIADYESLLADDFRFYLADEARGENPRLPEFWTKEQDVAVTRGLFSDSTVIDIRIALQFGSPRPVNDPGRENWQRIVVLDTFLEVEHLRDASHVDGQAQRFCFRKGRTPEDSTSADWYLVEWRDFGHSTEPPGGTASNP